ncbi:MAG TPA: HAD-IIA family hydrolase [Herpetosiphonaceae bacterium]
MPINLSTIRAVLLDMDGVLYRGSEILPGAAALPATLERLGLRFLCLTNNSTRTPESVSAALAEHGVPIAGSHIMTTSTAAGRLLRERYPAGTPTYALGMEGLQQALFADGWFAPAGSDAALVVVGTHFGLTYDHLKIATLALRAGADFIATNPDTTFPSPEGLIPGCGAIVAALTAASGRVPEIIGKPQPAMFAAALHELGIGAGEALMVGDRLDTDIAGAQGAGIAAVFVASGVNTPDEARAWSPPPDLLCAHVGELLELLVAAHASGDPGAGR